MARDPLECLIRLRRNACDDARRNLVRCLGTEAQAQAAADEAERTIGRETHAATALTGDDSVVEAFAAWLPGARRRADDARDTVEHRQAETTRARACVTACRTALESVETLRDRRVRTAIAADARRWQEALDEAGRSVSSAAPAGLKAGAEGPSGS